MLQAASLHGAGYGGDVDVDGTAWEKVAELHVEEGAGAEAVGSSGRVVAQIHVVELLGDDAEAAHAEGGEHGECEQSAESQWKEHLVDVEEHAQGHDESHSYGERACDAQQVGHGGVAYDSAVGVEYSEAHDEAEEIDCQRAQQRPKVCHHGRCPVSYRVCEQSAAYDDEAVSCENIPIGHTVAG